MYVLSSTASGQLLGQHECKITTAMRQTKQQSKKLREWNQLKLFTFKHQFIKLSLDLQTVLSAETHLAEGQCLEEPLSMIKLRKFLASTRIQMVSWRGGQ
jgi:hypothetical protein